MPGLGEEDIRQRAYELWRTPESRADGWIRSGMRPRRSF